jgi:2-methylisocitrate lyase-like PEP mutase family enzyme
LVTKTTRLRELIEQPDLLVLPGVYDGYSMRLVEQAGYEAAFVTGAGVAEALLGYPDVGLMNGEENLFVTRRLAAVAGIPLLADADTGYGNAVNVFQTVRAFEAAGVAGVMLEDQTWPKRCGHLPGKSLIAQDEMVEKVRAAVEGRKDGDLIIKARTDAVAVEGIDSAIHRLNLYADAGADVLMADALPSIESMRLVCKEVPKPVCINMGFGIRSRATTPVASPAQLADIGAAAAIYPRLLTAAAIRGMSNALDAFRKQAQTGIVEDRDDLAVSFEEINSLVGEGEIADIERRVTNERSSG